MVAVTLPVQWAWTRLQAKGTRHQTGRADTHLGLRRLHRGNFQEGGNSKFSKNLEPSVPPTPAWNSESSL